METTQITDEDCKHCRNNPNAEKPYVKMKRFKITDFGGETTFHKYAEKFNVRLGCVLCHAARSLVRTPIEDVLRILGKRKAQRQGD